MMGAGCNAPATTGVASRSPPLRSAVAWIVVRVDVRHEERADGVELDDRLAARHRVVCVVRRNAHEAIATEGMQRALRELLPHAGEERPLKHGHVLDRGMRVRGDLVASRELQ